LGHCRPIKVLIKDLRGLHLKGPYEVSEIPSKGLGLIKDLGTKGPLRFFALEALEDSGMTLKALKVFGLTWPLP
jgi:hypothetical protein